MTALTMVGIGVWRGILASIFVQSLFRDPFPSDSSTQAGDWYPFRLVGFEWPLLEELLPNMSREGRNHL